MYHSPLIIQPSTVDHQHLHVHAHVAIDYFQCLYICTCTCGLPLHTVVIQKVTNYMYNDIMATHKMKDF